MSPTEFLRVQRLPHKTPSEIKLRERAKRRHYTLYKVTYTFHEWMFVSNEALQLNEISLGNSSAISACAMLPQQQHSHGKLNIWPVQLSALLSGCLQRRNRQPCLQIQAHVERRLEASLKFGYKLEVRRCRAPVRRLPQGVGNCNGQGSGERPSSPLE